MRGNGFKSEECRFGLDNRKKFFTVGLVRHQSRLPSKVVNASSLEAFKARLGRTFQQPGLQGGIPAYSLGVGLRHLQGPFQSKPFYASIFMRLFLFSDLLCFLSRIILPRTCLEDVVKLVEA